MPTSTSAAGFPNAPQPLFKLLALPNSCEHIAAFDKYYAHMFDHSLIYLVTTRPSTANGLLLQFNLNFNSPYSYPKHYLEIVFKDLTLSSVQLQYQTPGATVPCTLSALFLPIASRIEPPHCVVANIDIYLGTILLRITDIGALVTGTYTVTLDNFLLPDMTTPL